MLASEIAPSSEPYGLYFLGRPLFIINIIVATGATSNAVVYGGRALP
ncbi:uncharacterized protein G2W53_014041 [Senna tora]|uniref:Uncharacterized protein n=1 Tax=Senna tora TaxID=362788 RepID=A0A834WRJ9_9FABA|nr:uncharacterized protein G2W53_014041 [Senna tora]